MDLDAAEVIAAHTAEHAMGMPWCPSCHTVAPCMTYRLAEALASSEAKVAVLEDDRDEWQRVAKAYLSCVAALNAPAADQ